VLTVLTVLTAQGVTNGC